MIDLIIFLILLALGYGAGSWAEKRHYRSIVKRESATINLPAVTLKSVDVPETHEAGMGREGEGAERQRTNQCGKQSLVHRTLHAPCAVCRTFFCEISIAWS